MANNRIFIYNKVTKKSFCIAKHLGGPWYISNKSKDELSDFFEDEENAKAFWECERCYEIKYEDEDFG